ncbi:MAG TPA: DUF131 domain-containing protein [Nitrososphaerales archaeon]|nr:DUF131 domain-containing protein [Nitrososphaerales archaeon]
MFDLVLVGVAIIIVGFFLVFLAVARPSGASEEGERRTETRGGGVILIGPIPIVFGSDARWASIAIVLTIVLVVIVLFSGALTGR